MSQPQCRLCWDVAGAPPGGVLLAPCACKGSCGAIHARCLQRQLAARPAAVCDVCRAPYDAAVLAAAGVALPPPPPLLPAIGAHGGGGGPPGWARDQFLQARAVYAQLAAARAAAAAAAGGGAGGAYAHGHPHHDLLGWPPAVLRARGAGWRPRWWHRNARSEWFWAGLLHGGWRLAVALDGARATLALLRARRPPAAALSWPWQLLRRPNGRGAARDAARAAAVRRLRRRRRPDGGDGADAASAAALSIAEEVRASFDGTTLWQVRVYTALIAARPAGALAEACGGMALGAVLGGVLSSAAFLPLVGLRRLDAAAGGARLALAAGARLAAGLACRPSGHRRLAALLWRARGGPGAWVRGALGGLGRRLQRRRQARGGGRQPPQQQQAPRAAAAAAAGPQQPFYQPEE